MKYDNHKYLGMLIFYANQHGKSEQWVASYYMRQYPKLIPPSNYMKYLPLKCNSDFIENIEEAMLQESMEPPFIYKGKKVEAA